MKEPRWKKERNERRGVEERSEEAMAFERRHHAIQKLWEHARARSEGTERRWDEKHQHIGFEALEEKVYQEYIHKGYPPVVARHWAKATAGRVWHRQHVG